MLARIAVDRCAKPIDLPQIFLSVTAVISDCSVDAVAHGCQKDHQRAEAIAEDGNLASAPRQLGHGVDSVLSVPASLAPARIAAYILV